MEAKEFKELYVEDGEVSLPGTDCVYVGDQIQEHKSVFQESVYKVNNEYFMVVNSWSNSGYWGDSEQDEPLVFKVEPKEYVGIKYVKVKES